MYKWVIVKQKLSSDRPDIISIWTPVWDPSNQNFKLYFANTNDLHFALTSSHSCYARWGLANCLFETEKQAEWYITTKMRHLNVDYKNTIRPALYWVDDYILKDLREALTLDKDRPDKVILNEYMQYLYSKMI